MTPEVGFRLGSGADGFPVTALGGAQASCFSVLLCVCEDELLIIYNLMLSTVLVFLERVVTLRSPSD